MSENPYQQQPTDPAAGADPYGSGAYGQQSQPGQYDPQGQYSQPGQYDPQGQQSPYGDQQSAAYGSYGTDPYAQQPGYAQPGYAQPGYAEQQPAYGAPADPYAQQGYSQYGAPQPGYYYEDPNAKSRLAAGLLGILLGSLGIHRFYLGYTGMGVLMLLLTVLSCGMLGGAVAIWGLVEGILYLTAKDGQYSVDATGRPLRS